MSTATKAEPPLAAAPVAPAVPAIEPLRIALDDDRPRAKPPTKRYWCGLRLDAPIENCAKGGVSLSKRVGKIQYDPNGQIENPDAVRLGNIFELTKDQIDVVLARIEGTYVRVIRAPDGRITQSNIISAKYLDAGGNWVADPRHELMPKDEPLGRYVYIQEVGEGQHVSRDHNSPTPAPLVR